MNFVKQNLFLICMLGVVLVIGGVLLALAGPAHKQARSHVEVRTRLSAQLASLTRGEGLGAERVRVNKKVVEAARHRVIKTREEYAEVVRRALERNRAHYRVLSFADPDNPSGPRLPAFPVNSQLYQRKGLRLLFPTEYRNRVLALLASMKPTSPPTLEEIKEQASVIADKERLKAEANGRPTTPRPTPARPTPPASRFLVGPPPPRMAEPGAPLAAAGQLRGQGQPRAPMTPEEKARLTLMLAKARLGDIYADGNSMHMVLVSDRVNYTNDMLWMAQVSLWVQQDIVAAINRTNREVLQRQELSGRKRDKGVLASAVKRLLKIRVFGYVVTPGGTEGPPRTGAPGGAAGHRGEVPPGRMGGGGAGGMGSRTLMFVGGIGGGSGPGMGANSLRAAPLSQRVCNKLYDVVQYQFSAVVSSSALLRLYRNLLLQNYHTILDVKVGRPGQQQGRMMERVRPSQPGGTELYYYGTDPVVEVTITGELLLLTDWTRGRSEPDGPSGQKKYPPLMPVDFLHLIARSDPSALRDEDLQRLKERGLEVGPTGYRGGGVGGP
ncbi:MAG: hypothetical protein B1H04_05395 [Planctomycetales bacterium 4484_123]|nr:MAG: hypothetical protein B1H04_05395 [Planctomycetales bacterium 4484_123]